MPFLVVFFGVALIVWGSYLTRSDLDWERAEVLRNAEINANNLARAFGEHVHQTIRRLDQAAIHLRNEYERDREAFLDQAREWQNTIYSDLVFQVSAVGPDGGLLFSNLKLTPDRVDLSDREHFRVPRDAADDLLFISKPVLGRVSGKWSIQFARRIRAPDGSFGGVLVLSVDPAYLSRFYDIVDVGKEGVIELIGTDRVLRARSPADPAFKDLAGEKMPDLPFFRADAASSGNYHLPDSADRPARIAAYRRLKDYPLIVNVQLSERDVLTALDHRRHELLVGGVIAALLVLGASLIIAWLIQLQGANQRRLEVAQRQLSESERRWRLALEAVGDGLWDWDAETNEVFFSPSWKSMLGYTEHEIGNQLAEWDSRVHPDDRDAVYADLGRHFSGQAPFYANEHRMLCKNGSYKWILDRGIVLSRKDDGSPKRVIGTHTDIERIKTAEEALKNTAAHLTAILDNAPVGITIVTPDRRIALVNPMMERLFLRRADDMVGASTRLLCGTDEDYERIGQHIYPVLMQGGTARNELRMVRGDGTPFWASVIGRRVSLDDPSLGIVWIIDDISAFKKAEQALQASLNFQRTLIDTVPLPIFVKDDACRFIEANQAFQRLIGLDRDGLIGKTVFDVAPPDLATVYQDADRDLLANPCTQVYEARMRTADGAERDVEFSKAVFVDSAGVPAGIVGAAVDLTTRKQAEQALRERQVLFEQMFVGSLAVKLLINPSDGSIVDANPAAAVFYGWSIEELRARRITDINILPEDKVRAEMERARFEMRQYFLFRHRLKSGEIRDVEVYSSPIVVGGRTLLLSLVHDVTLRRKAEEELQAQTAELHRSNAELEAFAYVASHDLRQPLRSVISYLTLLEQDLDGKLDPDCQEYLEFARDGARRMDRLIVDLLEYSRVGRKTRPFEDCAAAAIVETALLNLESAIEEAGAAVCVDSALPVLWGDENELMRLFQNLIGNAIKYRADDRAATVHVACRAEDGVWHFTVADNGIGIAQEHLDRVFGIFQRLHTRDRYEGTGIGLALCKKIVEHHHGRIWAESEPGVGSTFHVALPQRLEPGA